MKIETKYNINDRVYYIDGHSIKCGIVSGLKYAIVCKRTYRDMLGNYLGPTGEVEELYQIGYDEIQASDIFKTKEELLNNLKDETDNNK